MKFKGCILLREVSFYCERAQNRLRGRGWSLSAIMPILKWLLATMACTCWLTTMEIIAAAGTETSNPGLTCELVSCPVEGLACHPGVVILMFLLFQECSQIKKMSLAYKSVKQNFIQQRFYFQFLHNLSLSDNGFKSMQHLPSDWSLCTSFIQGVMAEV